MYPTLYHSRTRECLGVITLFLGSDLTRWRPRMFHMVRPAGRMTWPWRQYASWRQQQQVCQSGLPPQTDPSGTTTPTDWHIYIYNTYIYHIHGVWDHNVLEFLRMMEKGHGPGTDFLDRAFCDLLRFFLSRPGAGRPSPPNERGRDSSLGSVRTSTNAGGSFGERSNDLQRERAPGLYMVIPYSTYHKVRIFSCARSPRRTSSFGMSRGARPGWCGVDFGVASVRTSFHAD